MLEYNKRAIRCYEKCGFVIEGIDGEGAVVEGKYETDIYMGILEDDYRKFLLGLPSLLLAFAVYFIMT